MSRLSNLFTRPATRRKSAATANAAKCAVEPLEGLAAIFGLSGTAPGHLRPPQGSIKEVIDELA